MVEYLSSALGLGCFYQIESKEHGRSDAMPVPDLAFQRAHSFLFLSLIFWLMESRCHMKKLPSWWVYVDIERGMSLFCLFVSSFCSPDMQMIEAILSLLALSGLWLQSHEWPQLRLVEKLLG